MTRIHAHGHPVALFNEIDNLAQVFKPVPDGRSLSRGCLKNTLDAIAGSLLVDEIQRLRDALDPFPLTGTHVRSGVEVEVFDTEHFASIKFILESFTRF